MNAHELLNQLLAMIDGTDFNRCSASRGFKGQYDVWCNNHKDELAALAQEDEKQRLEQQPENTVTEVSPDDNRVMVPVEEFIEESTDAGTP